MQLPIEIFYGDEESASYYIAPERELYLAVFASAVTDLLGSNLRLKLRAIDWFRGDEGSITFNEIKEMFNFTKVRLTRLYELIDEEKPLREGRFRRVKRGY